MCAHGADGQVVELEDKEKRENSKAKDKRGLIFVTGFKQKEAASSANLLTRPVYCAGFVLIKHTLTVCSAVKEKRLHFISFYYTGHTEL